MLEIWSIHNIFNIFRMIFVLQWHFDIPVGSLRWNDHRVHFAPNPRSTIGIFTLFLMRESVARHWLPVDDTHSFYWCFVRQNIIFPFEHWKGQCIAWNKIKSRSATRIERIRCPSMQKSWFMKSDKWRKSRDSHVSWQLASPLATSNYPTMCTLMYPRTPQSPPPREVDSSTRCFSPLSSLCMNRSHSTARSIDPTAHGQPDWG